MYNKCIPYIVVSDYKYALIHTCHWTSYYSTTTSHSPDGGVCQMINKERALNRCL